MFGQVALKLDSYNYGMDFHMGEKIQNIFSTYKNGVFVKNQEKTPSFPSQVKHPSFFKFDAKNPLDFAHLGKTKTSLVHILEKPEEALCYMKDEAEVFNKVYQSYCQLSYNNEHKETFNIERSSYSTEDLARNKYLWDFKNFIQDVLNKVYKNIYGVEGNFTNNIPCEAKDMTNYMFNSQSLLFDDLTNELALKTVLSIRKVLDEITDDETTNCFIMNTHSFLHPINYLLSPAALSVSFFNSELITQKKPYRDEYYYSKRSLPSVTYLNISGIYSEIDIDILHAFSENIQTIMIYDENTGGPSILSKEEYKPEIDGRKNPRDFHTISDKLLLIPLKCDKNRKEKSYSQNDILSIIEQMVVGAIAKFKPSYVVLNCSLIHGNESKTPFCIDGNTLGKIIQLISVLSDQKIIVYPFKLPDLTTNKSNQRIFERSQDQRSRYIFEKYAIPYQPKFVLDCFVSCIEALADMKEDSAWERTTMRRLAGENPLRSQMLYMIGRHYKKHPYYNFLYSKSLGPLAVSSRKSLGVGVSVPNTKAKPLSYLPFFSVLEKLETRKLQVDNGRMCEVVIEENSQYLVDYYSEKSNPTVYVFNARIAEKTCGITTYGPVCHAAFQIDLENLGPFREHFVVTEIIGEEKMMRKDFGLCKCESFVFQVYGTKITNNKEDSNEICYFDFESSECFKLEIKGEQPEILPRHGVTVCAFQREGRYYLYVFGGQVQNDVVYGNKRLGSLDVIDIVEVYSTEDPRGAGGWDYKVFQKGDITKNEKISFIPFQNSFAHYDEKRDEILLMGGSQFVNSVYEWNFPVFVFDVKAGKFTKFDMFLNDVKGNLKRKTISNDQYALPVVPMAIADQNKNFFYNADNGTFEFVVMNRLNKIGCKYSYNRETSECDLTQVLLKLDDKDNDVKRITPPRLNETENSEKLPALSIEISKRLSLFLTSLSQKKFFLEMVMWRMETQKEVISKSDLEIYLSRKKNQVQEEDENSILDQLKFTSQMEQIDQLFQIEEIQNLFLKKSSELEVVKKYLLFGCDWVEVKYEMVKSAENSTQEDCPLDKTNPLNVARLDITVQNQTAELESHSSSNKVDEMSMSFSKPPSSSSFIVVEGEGLKKKDESGTGSVAEEPKSKDYSIIETSQILQQSYSQIAGSNANLDKRKSKDYSIVDTSRSLEQSYSRIIAGHTSLDNFKECLRAEMNSHRVFVNKAKNGIIVVKDNNPSVCQNLLFKVNVKDELEEMSFNLSPSSVTVFRSAIVCYIDQQFKITHPEIYHEYKNWILYADLNLILSSTVNGRKSIVFERLIQLTADDNIFNRSLLVSEQSLFLFGGKSVKYKGKQRVAYHKNLSRYDLKKLTDLNQTASAFRDTDIDDEMESNKGECAVVYAGDFIYVCQKNSPQNLEIFQEDGVLEENIELKIDTEGYTAFMNPILFEEKPHILITLCKIDEDMKFILYDIQDKVLVTKNVTIIPKGEEVTHPLFYSGFEEIEVSITGEFKNEILIYNYRGDAPKIIPYVVKM